MLLSTSYPDSASFALSVRRTALRSLVPSLPAANSRYDANRSKQRQYHARISHARARVVVRAADNTSAILIATPPLEDLVEPDYSALAGELARDLLEQPWLLLLLVVAAAFAVPRVVNKFIVPGVSFILLAVVRPLLLSHN